MHFDTQRTCSDGQGIRSAIIFDVVPSTEQDGPRGATGEGDVIEPGEETRFEELAPRHTPVQRAADRAPARAAEPGRSSRSDPHEPGALALDAARARRSLRLRQRPCVLEMQVVEGDKPVLAMRVIVGDPMHDDTALSATR